METNVVEDFGYFAKTVADRVGISKDTLRTWSLKLEAEGVEFERNARGQRIYYEKDIRALENMKELMDFQQPLNDTAKTISDKVKKEAYALVPKEKNAENTLSVSHGENELITQEKRMQIFKENMLQDFEKSQQEALEKFKKEIAMEMAVVMQDRFENAVETAVKTALLQERKALAKEVAQELAAATAEPEKKGFWKRLFG